MCQYINEGTCETLVQALDISRLDYGKVLLFAVPFFLILLPQRAQTCAARLVDGTGKTDHITPIVFQFYSIGVRLYFARASDKDYNA